jgi:xanthine/CO dehydrogenase XdhC/CoxF family maturation factor
MGWDVRVLDARPVFLSRERFPLADDLVRISPEAVLRGASVDAGTAAVVMSHDFFQDLAVLEALVTQPLNYLGILGPRSRTERLLRELSPHARDVAKDTIPRLHAPVGLDIGAETPEEIALAVVAEIQATLRARPGGPLRDRVGPIHGRTAELQVSMSAALELRT